MNALAEALGMSLPGCAAIPAPYRERGQIAYETGVRAVEIVREDLKPSDILTRAAFENAIVACSAIGGSTNAPIHLNAHRAACRRARSPSRTGRRSAMTCRFSSTCSRPANISARIIIAPADCRRCCTNSTPPDGFMATRCTINGKTIAENVARAKATDAEVIWPYDKPMKAQAGFKVLRGNLFDSAIMKTSVISDEFRQRYLSNPKDPNAFEGRAVVFDGPEDYHARIDDPALGIDEHTILFMRGVGPIGYPGSAEVVNMQPPAALIKKGVTALACVGDGRQSGTSGSPSILNASPEAAVGGGLALAANRRPRAHRSQQRHRRYADLRRGIGGAARGAAKERRLSLSAEPDAVAGNPARHGRSARGGHGAAAGGQISARGAEIRAAR